jgi:hypothetical protein
VSRLSMAQRLTYQPDLPKGKIKVLDAEQVVPTSGSSSYRTQVLVKFMIAFCGAFTLTFAIWTLGLASSRSAAGNSR